MRWRCGLAGCQWRRGDLRRECRRLRGRVGSGRAVAGGTIRVAAQRPKTLDPVNMVDLAAYGLVAQSMEFLCTLNTDASDIAPGLALKWAPNDTNSVWTFDLREGRHVA